MDVQLSLSAHHLQSTEATNAMPNRIFLKGQRFTRLLVIEDLPIQTVQRSYVRCRCDCGQEVVVRTNALRTGATQSCGCLFREKARISGLRRRVHGYAGMNHATPTYRTWCSMIARCTYPSMNCWRYYGGRGIAVCERWKDFSNFLADMGERPIGKTLDRIQVNGNYEPSNCRWATAKQQAQNRRKRQ